MDDIIITASKREFLTNIVFILHKSFALKDLGPLHFFFLGIQVTRTTIGFFLSQSKYAKDLLCKFSMDKVKTCPTPMAQNVHLSAAEEIPMEDSIMYRSAKRALQYLTHTRPDLSFSVNRLSQFLQCPTNIHWKSLK